MNFHVDPKQGHDDSLMSLDLVNEASTDSGPREAEGGLPHELSRRPHTPICFPKKTSVPEHPTAFMVDLR
jgi:hypothetical protein